MTLFILLILHAGRTRTMINTKRLCTGLIAILCGFGAVRAQTAEVTQRVVPVAELTDLDFIGTFLDEQFIFPANPDYQSAIFLDVTRDGFGSNDLLVLYPAEEQFLISGYLPDQLADALREQGMAADYSLSTTRELVRVVADEAEDESDSKKALAGAMLRSVLTYYPAGDFQGYFFQQGDNVEVNFWGYSDDLWRFVPEATQCLMPDAEPVVLLVHRQPETQTFLDVDGCVVVEASTTGADVISRVCR